ncbi:GNAT family N-acetyltransferase [Lentisphaerota bacterium ZTH]|nr:GNAT family N-acetyltransferase [Lentisphaerota bacterium]WET07110.1 GNAT family N-acetyltransferase [Lentisphaerota bacterium ZTH]
MMQIAQYDDLKTIIKWIKSSGEAKLWGREKIRYPLSVETLIDDIKFSSHHSYSFFSDGKLFGFAQIIDIEENTGLIARVIIKPELRGTGYGKRLFKALIRHCDSNCYAQLTLKVYKSNSPAINLYRSFGFQISKKDDLHESLSMNRFKK